jgi:hypothetical protein
MESNKTPKFSNFLPAAIILVISGLGGLYFIFNFTTPSGGTRWAFFFFSVLALTGFMLPVVSFLNLRFPSNPPASASVVIRQALWVGIYFPILAWLRIGRILTLAIALLLAAGFFLIEWLLRLREFSLWKPKE